MDGAVQITEVAASRFARCIQNDAAGTDLDSKPVGPNFVNGLLGKPFAELLRNCLPDPRRGHEWIFGQELTKQLYLFRIASSSWVRPAHRDSSFGALLL